MEESRYHFEKLTPIDDVELGVYEDAIDYVFKYSDIKNVAISGAYSAGKSSILASYKKQNKNLKFLHISLAHFQSSDQEEATEVKESVLEGKILNQLIHQIPSEKIPQTNFRVKKKIYLKSVIIRTAEIVLFLVSFIYFTCFDTWKDYVDTLPNNWFKSILSFSTSQYAFIAVIIISFMIYKIIIVQKNKNIFRKLNLQGNEIEIFEESDDSYFDKYLNEVLYLFENADVDVIVFEDIDRFNASRIFERLREINTLANIQLQKENKKVLRFFYLLRDDIFISKDRTKFFDYIIPIVPVIDGSNSYDQFISHFKRSGVFEKFDKNFLQGLSLYIDDMRLLKNIYNEFVIYNDRINTTELDCNKMLAIITYKNLFPRDFTDLQLNQGFVFTIFNNKDKFKEKDLQKLNEQISKKEQEIEMTKDEHLKTIKELDIIFNERKNRNFCARLTDEDKIEHSERKKAIENRLNNKISVIENEKIFLEQQIVLMKNKQLKDIITRESINSIFSITSENEIGTVSNFNEIKSSEYFDILKYLIRNGYIDENYADYMTYFYENSLNRVDKIFLRSITDKKAKEYTYQLKNPELVVSRLKLSDFDQEEILNFDLLTYLLHTSSQFEYMKRFINQLKNTKNFRFINAFFDITTELPNYIKYLNIQWTEIFLTILNEQPLTEEQTRRYSIFSIYYSDDETVKLMNENNCLRNYISNSRDYLAIDNPIMDRLIHCFILLKVCFIGFDYEKLNKELFHAVYEKSLYEINVENLILIQKKILDVENDEDIFHRNYTILYSHSNSAITQYINQNINKYFDVILQLSNGSIYDDENVAIAVLNNSELTMEHKYSYISTLQTTIISIKEIVDCSLWSSLLDTDIVRYSEHNIINCFDSLKLEESVVSYINRCNIELNFSNIEYSGELKEELFDNVIICESIENSKYKQILTSLNYRYSNFTITDISQDKMDILIDTNIIKMTTNNLEFMRESYSNQKYFFIRKNIDNYIDIMNDDLFLFDELLEVLMWDISDEIKIKLIEFSKDEISVIEKNYSSTVCLYILNNNFMNSDLINLFSSFERWDESIQLKIFEYAIKNIENIINNSSTISHRLIDNLFHSDKLDRDIKIDLLIAIIPYINENYMQEILTLLNLNSYLKIFKHRSQQRFKINNENKKLLSAFKKIKLIRDYQEDDKKEGYYKIIRYKNR